MQFSTSIVDFAEQSQPVWLVLHVLSTIFGVGGASIADVLFFRFLKDFRISKREADVLRFLASLIMASIVMLFVTGFFLVLAQPALLTKATFQVKMVAVVVVTVNGVMLHTIVAPRLIRLSFVHQAIGKPLESRGWQRAAFALGSISVCSWYTAFFIAMLKRHIALTFVPLLSVYLCVLVFGIVASQIVEGLMLRAAEQAVVEKGKASKRRR